MGRIGNAVRALRGHAAPCRTCESHIRRIESEWRTFELELTGYMEKMNAWAARQAKRDKRAQEVALDASSYEQPVQAPPATPKAILRAQYGAAIAAGRLGTARGGGVADLSPAGGDGGSG